MRLRSLFLLALLALFCLPLTACCGDGGFTLRSPLIAAEAPPRIVPTQWGVMQRTETMGVVQAMPAGVCAPAYAPAPQMPYAPGYQYAAPPSGDGCR